MYKLFSQTNKQPLLCFDRDVITQDHQRKFEGKEDAGVIENPIRDTLVKLQIYPSLYRNISNMLQTFYLFLLVFQDI